MNYTLILYRPDGCTVCRGCEMERWSSDLSLVTDLTESNMITTIVSAFTTPSSGGNDEAHVFTIRDGIQIIHTFKQYSDWQGTTYSHTTNSNRLSWEEDEKEGDRLNAIIKNTITETRRRNELITKRKDWII